MAKFKKFSVAVFETPTECIECPCARITPEYYADLCLLKNRPISLKWMVGPIPEWCPLKTITFGEEYKDETKTDI